MAMFANKFTVQIQNDGLSRITFVDERPPMKDGFPMTHKEVADLMMKTSDLIQLRDLLDELIRRTPSS